MLGPRLLLFGVEQTRDPLVGAGSDLLLRLALLLVGQILVTQLGERRVLLGENCADRLLLIIGELCRERAVEAAHGPVDALVAHSCGERVALRLLFFRQVLGASAEQAACLEEAREPATALTVFAILPVAADSGEEALGGLVEGVARAAGAGDETANLLDGAGVGRDLVENLRQRAVGVGTLRLVASRAR